MQNRQTILGVIEMREQGTPYTLCQDRFGIGSSVVTAIMQQYKLLGRSLEELKTLPAGDLEALFFPPGRRRRKKAELPDFEEVYARMHEKNSRLNVAMLWEEYRQREPDGYSYSQFLRHYRKYVESVHGTGDVKMIVRRVPGERMYVDWMGDTPKLLLDRRSGELVPVHIFCATLGVSSLGYVEVFEDEKLESFVRGIVHALEYYGGVPRFIVPDNLRTAVTKHTKDALILTQACRDLENYYDTGFLPTPPAKPTGKGAVEKFVGDMESRLVELLKGTSYTGVEEIMDKAAPIVEAFNNRTGRERSQSRREIFENLDKPRLKPLPSSGFTVWDYAIVSRVPNTYHVTYDHHQYSVPFEMTGKPAVIKASMGRVVVTDENNNVIAEHKRSYADFPREVTDPSHMPPAHRFYADVNTSDGSVYRKWAESVGDATVAIVERILSAGSREEQMYRPCMSLMLHARGIDPQIVEEAARICLETGQTTCSAFEKAITSHVNASKEAPARAVPEHSNIRGKEYFV